ncbi:MAG TPA: transglycosylase SLT domain-containing protein, partial [Opitutaceae bacterium]
MKFGRIALALLLAGCSRHRAGNIAESVGSLEMRRQVWEAIGPLAERGHLDPLFVYAIAKAESNFEPRAVRGEARGLMQIKPRAWRAVTNVPYEAGVWTWRSNLAVGIDVLASMKGDLEKRHAFSYPVLWACYHYGFEFVSSRGFDMSR